MNKKALSLERALGQGYSVCFETAYSVMEKSMCAAFGCFVQPGGNRQGLFNGGELLFAGFFVELSHYNKVMEAVLIFVGLLGWKHDLLHTK